MNIIKLIRKWFSRKVKVKVSPPLLDVNTIAEMSLFESLYHYQADKERCIWCDRDLFNRPGKWAGRYTICYKGKRYVLCLGHGEWRLKMTTELINLK